MLDDLRDHDPKPSREELGWMNADPLSAATRALVLVGVSLMIGVAASYFVSPDDPGVANVASIRGSAP
ncbi:MAG TPA: hypothetical protein VN782_01105 [Usitatibacter sp.]|nr:hypothetical protein [Usitatibacter sp.]